MEKGGNSHGGGDACVLLIDFEVRSIKGSVGKARGLFERTRIPDPIHSEGKLLCSVSGKTPTCKAIDDSELRS